MIQLCLISRLHFLPVFCWIALCYRTLFRRTDKQAHPAYSIEAGSSHCASITQYYSVAFISTESVNPVSFSAGIHSPILFSGLVSYFGCINFATQQLFSKPRESSGSSRGCLPFKTERFLKAILEMFCTSRFGTAIWSEQTFILEQNYIHKYFFFFKFVWHFNQMVWKYLPWT